MPSAPYEILLRFFPHLVIDHVERIITEEMKKGTHVLAMPPGHGIEESINMKAALHTHRMWEEVEGVVLCADIKGYVELSDKLIRGVSPAVDPDRESPPLSTGVEKGTIKDVTNLLNACLDQLTKLVTDHGGDIVKFAGDGVTALWPTKHHTLSLRDLTLLATSCALAIQGAMRAAKTREVRLEDARYRIGIGAGRVLHGQVGGELDRWEFLISGDAMVQAAMAESHAPEGEDVLLSPGAAALVQDACHWHPDSPSTGGRRCTGLKQPMMVPGAWAPNVTPELVQALRALLPGPVAGKVGRSIDLEAEVRPVTMLFLYLKDIHTEPEVARAQDTVLGIQKIIYSYQGSVHKLLATKDGWMLVAAWGLPPQEISNNAARAVKCALVIFNELGPSSRIGVTSGRLYYGVIGSSLRNEFTVIGMGANMASRLATHASNQGIFCDQATWSDAREEVEFDDIVQQRSIKGVQELVSVYVPLRARNMARSTLVDRREETAEVARILSAVRNTKGSHTLYLAGHQGAGKTAFLEFILGQARVFRFRVLRGVADSNASAVPYHAWKPIFQKVLGSGGVLDEGDGASSFWARFQGDTRLQQLKPLLNVVSAVRMPDNEVTAQFDDETRADNTRYALLRILHHFSASFQEPLLVAFDDTQWLDSASLTLCRLFHNHVQGALLLMASRPLTRASMEVEGILADPATTRLEVSGFRPKDTDEFICRCLEAKEVERDVTEQVHARTAGNALFIQQIVQWALSRKAIAVTDGLCRPSENWSQLEANKPAREGEAPITAAISSVVLSRIDPLDEALRHILRVASVIGREFPLRVLTDIYPYSDEIPRLLDNLAILEELELLSRPVVEGGPWSFRHGVFQESIYENLDPERRFTIHRDIANWYVQNHRDLSPYYHLLAFHYDKAREVESAVLYLEKAGEQSTRGGAYQEAADCYKAILDHCAAGAYIASPEKRAAWEYLLGESMVGVGRQKEGRRHLVRALALLGHPVPHSMAGVLFGVATGCLRQVWRRLTQRGIPIARIQATENLTMVSRSFARVAQSYYFTNEPVRMLYTSLRSLNTTERWGTSAELSKAYANNCLSWSALGADAIAARYGELARSAADAIQDRASQAWALELTQGLVRLWKGEWTEAAKALEDAARLCDAVMDKRRWAENVGLWAFVLQHQGAFVESLRRWNQVQEVSRQRGDNQQTCWGLIGALLCRLRLNEMEAVPSLMAGIARFSIGEEVPKDVRIWAAGALAEASLRVGDPSAALQHARRGIEVTTDRRYFLHLNAHAMDGFFAIPGTILALEEAGAGLSQEARSLRHGAFDGLRVFARGFPIGRPRLLLYEGTACWLDGRTEKARRYWLSSVKAAHAMNMLYEEGLAELELGRHLPWDDGGREHLEAAGRLLAEVGADWELNKVLEATPPQERRRHEQWAGGQEVRAPEDEPKVSGSRDS